MAKTDVRKEIEEVSENLEKLIWELQQDLTEDELIEISDSIQHYCLRYQLLTGRSYTPLYNHQKI